MISKKFYTVQDMLQELYRIFTEIIPKVNALKWNHKHRFCVNIYADKNEYRRDDARGLRKVPIDAYTFKIIGMCAVQDIDILHDIFKEYDHYIRISNTYMRKNYIDEDHTFKKETRAISEQVQALLNNLDPINPDIENLDDYDHTLAFHTDDDCYVPLIKVLDIIKDRDFHDLNEQQVYNTCMDHLCEFMPPFMNEDFIEKCIKEYIFHGIEPNFSLKDIGGLAVTDLLMYTRLHDKFLQLDPFAMSYINAYEKKNLLAEPRED